MSIAASALSCALEVREAQVAPEPAAEHDDAAASRWRREMRDAPATISVRGSNREKKK
jgi:hypothetical protein